MIAYIIKLVLCSALLLSAYKLLLEKEKMHRFSRFYLLASIALSFVVPFLTFNEQVPAMPVVETFIYLNIPDQQTATSPLIDSLSGLNYTNIGLLVVYIGFTSILLTRFIINLRSILHAARVNAFIDYKGARLILVDSNTTPHSFLNYIFISRPDYENGDIKKEILLHELTHVRQKHSIDILFIELLQIFCWINPLLFLYRKAIQLNHEFLADNAVINTTIDTTGYQHLLIDSSGKQHSSILTSQFNYLITKKRLLMITKNTSRSRALCKQFAILLVTSASVLLFSKKTVAQTPSTLVATQKEAPSTQEGVSQALMDEYARIVDETKNEKGHPVYNKFSAADKARLETIFLSMSKEQQAKQVVVFMPALGPMPKAVPTTAQIESWKDGKTYGLWIDGKRASNAVLNNYKNTDFAHLFVSKLSKNAVNYGKHYYQVDLMTIPHYEQYRKEALANKNKFYMAIRWR
jgi:bla regulator protein BlaR1